MSLRCTTHFHACDCREEKFKLLQSQLDEANKVIEFYGDINTWQLRTFNETGVQKGWAMRVRDSDCGFINGPNRNFGGKRARAFQEKYLKKEDVR